MGKQVHSIHVESQSTIEFIACEMKQKVKGVS
jgi:hypothetical protein